MGGRRCYLSGLDFTAYGKMQTVEQEASGHDFTAYGKMQTVEQEASGHDFSRAEIALFDVLKGHGFTACGKMQMVEQEASGHDFSRAANGIKMNAGFSPGENFPLRSGLNQGLLQSG